MIKYTLHLELFCNVNIYSVHEILPKINKYNKKIAKFVEDVNIKYGIQLNYTQQEVSEIKHWAETFKVVVNTSSQSEQQQVQVLQIAVAVPSPQTATPFLRQQEEDINKLTYVAEQWSAEEPCRINEGITHYNTIGRSRSTYHHSMPNMSPVSLDTDNIGTITMIEGHSIPTGHSR